VKRYEKSIKKNSDERKKECLRKKRVFAKKKSLVELTTAKIIKMIISEISSLVNCCLLRNGDQM
jgi:hypothetical protein